MYANICVIVEIYLLFEKSHGLLNNKNVPMHPSNQPLQTLSLKCQNYTAGHVNLMSMTWEQSETKNC